MEIWYTLTGAIDPNAAGQMINWVVAQIHTQEVKKLKFLISSNGGDVDSAIRIYTFLKSLPFEVEAIGFSQIDSAANIAFLGGGKRVAVKGCRFFLHEGTFTIGNATASLHTHEETLTVLQNLLKRHVEILVGEIRKDEEEIKEALNNGVILNAEEAKEYGIVHEVVESLPLVRQQNS